MNSALLKGLMALGAGIHAVFWFGRLVLPTKEVLCLLQLLGAGCLVIVAFTHICEALGLFPWMHWGLEGKRGQYLDSGVLRRSTLFPVGYLFMPLQIDMRSKTWPVIGTVD